MDALLTALTWALIFKVLFVILSLMTLYFLYKDKGNQFTTASVLAVCVLICSLFIEVFGSNHSNTTVPPPVATSGK